LLMVGMHLLHLLLLFFSLLDITLPENQGECNWRLFLFCREITLRTVRQLSDPVFAWRWQAVLYEEEKAERRLLTETWRMSSYP
ncbi:MAG TPA: hypothetical protein VFG09_03000, partial [Thermodesulfovibrionales bacterium]|nr:hypothetical protein [Thermodesulfovibrionales bacterium]